MSERIDMSEFEAQFGNDQFSPLMSNDDFERLAFLKERIEDITNVLAFRDERRLEILGRAEEINRILREFEQIMSRLRALRDPLTDEVRFIRQKGIDDAQKMSAYEREMARLEAEIEARRRFLDQRNELDGITANYPWRVGVDGKKALPHQIEGAHRLVSSKRAILGDKPGLGKTLQAIMTIDLLRGLGEGKKVLIFTPKSVLRDFERAFQRWTNPTFVHVLNQTIKGIKAEMLSMLSAWPEAIVITNYEVWRKDASIKEQLKLCGFDTIILDEAHNLKNHKSGTYKGIREIVYAKNRCPKCGSQNVVQNIYGANCGACENYEREFGDFCSIKNVIPMTGTPILNKPQELWPLLNLVDRIGFPDEKSFLNDYCVQKYDYANERYYWTFESGGEERLLKKLGMRFTARTRDSAGVKMPPQEVRHHYLELDPEKYPKQAAFIKALKERAVLAFSEKDQMSTPATLAWYTRMRQAASWPDAIQILGCPHDPQCLYENQETGLLEIKCYEPKVVFPPPNAEHIGESVLMDEAWQIISEAVENGNRIVVFSFYLPVLAELERRCNENGLRNCKITGGVTGSKRQEFVDDFNLTYTKVGEHKYDVMLAQFQTADTGLNLNGAQEILCIERPWNPGKEEQTFDRVRRIDSETESIVHLLHCEGTATDLIDALVDTKQKMLDGFEEQVNINMQDEMRKWLKGEE